MLSKNDKRGGGLKNLMYYAIIITRKNFYENIYHYLCGYIYLFI